MGNDGRSLATEEEAEGVVMQGYALRRSRMACGVTERRVLGEHDAGITDLSGKMPAWFGMSWVMLYKAKENASTDTTLESVVGREVLSYVCVPCSYL